MSTKSSPLTLEMFSTKYDIFDLIILGQKMQSIPCTGSDIISLVNKYEVKSFVINSLLPTEYFYSVFYTDEPNYIINNESNEVLSSFSFTNAKSSTTTT